MAVAYDSFNYPSYWLDREYEHKSELIVLSAFLNKIHKIDTIVDIGCGFGRLFLNYSFRAKKIILTDPSIRLLKIAKDTFRKRKNIVYKVSTLQGLPKKIGKKADLAIMVRVIHHIDNANLAFKALNTIIAKGGYLILEFANKRHAKAVIKSFIKGNFGPAGNYETADIRSIKSKSGNTLPFLNYHPEIIGKLLATHGFEVIDKRSVSNFRSPLVKSMIPLNLLLLLEKLLQKPLAFFDFGPSIFVLAKKRL